MNGYIDDEAWFGDEITPESLHALLYPEGADAQEDLRIILNSYGGSCNAAVRMFDDLRAYPGQRPHHRLRHGGFGGDGAGHGSGPAGDDARLAVDDPRPVAWPRGATSGIWRKPVRLLRACKESILNVYGQALPQGPAGEIGAMMRDTTWMDAGAALQDGFIDGIVDMGSGAVNAAPCHETSLAEAKAKVAAWLERTRPSASDAQKHRRHSLRATVKETPTAETTAGCPNRTRRSGKRPGSPLRPASPPPSSGGGWS